MSRLRNFVDAPYIRDLIFSGRSILAADKFRGRILSMAVTQPRIVELTGCFC